MASKHFSFEPESHFFFLFLRQMEFNSPKASFLSKNCQTHTIWQNMFSHLSGLTPAAGTKRKGLFVSLGKDLFKMATVLVTFFVYLLMLRCNDIENSHTDEHWYCCRNMQRIFKKCIWMCTLYSASVKDLLWHCAPCFSARVVYRRPLGW